MAEKRFDLNNGCFAVKGKVKDIESYVLQDGNKLKMKHDIEIQNYDNETFCYYLKDDALEINQIKGKDVFLIIDKQNNILNIESKLPRKENTKDIGSRLIKNLKKITIGSSIFLGLVNIYSIVMFKTGTTDLNDFVNGLILTLPLFISSIIALSFSMSKEFNDFKEKINTRKKINEWLYEEENVSLGKEINKKEKVKV